MRERDKSCTCYTTRDLMMANGSLPMAQMLWLKVCLLEPPETGDLATKRCQPQILPH